MQAYTKWPARNVDNFNENRTPFPTQPRDVADGLHQPYTNPPSKSSPLDVLATLNELATFQEIKQIQEQLCSMKARQMDVLIILNGLTIKFIMFRGV